MDEKLPKSVRYVKNGKSGQCWHAAKDSNQIHLGWKEVPKGLLSNFNESQLREWFKDYFRGRRGETQALNALSSLLRSPSSHIWMTFEDGFLWWCTVLDGTTVNPEGESNRRGNFWLTCDREWSKYSLKGRLLSRAELPGIVTTTAGFKGTVCEPGASEAILRIIHGIEDPDVIEAEKAKKVYQKAIQAIVKRLTWRDFEQLIDLILNRSGWQRIDGLGGNTEGVDLEVQNVAADEIAFVQVKSRTTQGEFDDYVQRFRRSGDRYARMIYAVHSPDGNISVPDGQREVQLWKVEEVADRVVRLGLGEWVGNRLG